MMSNLLWLAGGLLLLLALAGGVAFVVVYLLTRKQPRPDYSEIVKLVSDGEGEEAERLLKRELTRVRLKDRYEVYLALGDVYRMRGNPRKAERIHRTLAASPRLPSPLAERVGISLASDALALGRPQRAEEALSSLKPLGMEARELLVHAHEEAGRYRRAFDEKTALLRSAGLYNRSRAAEYGAFLATLALSRGRSEEAKELLDEARKLGDGLPAVRFAEGAYNYETKEFEGAKESWGSLLASEPRYAAALFPRLEKLFFDTDDYDRLLSVYGSIADPLVRAEYAVALAKKGDSQGTKKALDSLLSQEQLPDAALPRIWRAALELSDRERMDRAARLLAARVERIEPYVCSSCSARAPAFQLACPRCRAVDALRPVSVKDGSV